MRIDDERDLHGQLEAAFEAITPRLAPVDGAVRRGRVIRVRRRMAVAAGAAAVAAIGVFAVPSLLHQTTPPASVSSAKPYIVTVQAPGPHPAPGLIASGTIDGRRWQLSAAKPGTGGAGSGGQIFTASGPAFGGDAGSQPGAALAVDSADPVSFSDVALTWGPVQVQYGAVRADVTYVTVRLGNGTVLVLHPVTVYGVRAVAFAVPVGAGVASAAAYSPHGQIAAAIPFNAPDGVAAFGVWLTPGQHGLARASGRIGSWTVSGRAWSVTAYLGPWGICIRAPATGIASAYCVPATAGLDLNSGVLAMTGGSGSVAAGHAPASAAWVIVNQPDGTTTKVWPVTVGGQRLFAFQLQTGPDPLSWTAYDTSGHVVAWPAG
ncbi:MAG: hypothetical protein ACRDOA_14810 [Streptosporangiaceae bacterium]